MAMLNNQRVIEFVAWVHCPTLSHLAFSAHRRQWTMAEDHPIPTDALAGLADRWESFAPIRQRFREEGGLLLWPTKDTVGVPSMKLGPQPGPLDLNLGTAELSEHRWTSTWDPPSSVSTAGPQPGTRRAQWAPLDLNLGPSELSDHRWTSTAR